MNNTLRLRKLLPLLLLFLLPALVTWFYLNHRENGLLPLLIYGLLKVTYIAAPLLWAQHHRTRNGQPQLPRIRSLFCWPTPRACAAGLLSGITMIAIMLTFYFAWFVHQPQHDSAAATIANLLRQFGLKSPALLLLFAIEIMLVNAWLEEFYWRWFGFRALRAHIAWPAAALLSGSLFSLHHYILIEHFIGPGGLTLLITAGVGLAGIIWAALYQRFPTLWSVFISHLLADFGIFIIAFNMLGPNLY